MDLDHGFHKARMEHLEPQGLPAPQDHKDQLVLRVQPAHLVPLVPLEYLVQPAQLAQLAQLA
jgi:hypothetical protein